MNLKKFILILICSLFMISINACTKDNSVINMTERKNVTDSMKLRITVREKILYADFVNSKTTEDFIKMLPLSLSMQDLKGREKYGSLSINLSPDKNIKTSFEEGEIAYWLGGGLAIFYHQDNSEIKAGLISIAQLKDGLEIFKESEDLKVKFEVINKENSH